eukprot:TRINITY_DN29780_c0_g1_i1.p1 TRINITY_DN29780_c0_g1~~TRINITY_DN29780_c0_g1_i1.p1  ORF type:complete len:263 (+),score=142.12 TRINITY_DN29780_c0_g1_i1:38-790(+)
MTKGKGDGSAALRKAFKGKDHDERGQTRARRRFGQLEKKKDYLVRAKSYKNKRDKLQKMRLAAATRNPDEFHTSMMNTETDEFGRHMRIVKAKKGPQQRRENADNARYLQYKAMVDGGEVKQLKADLSFLDAPATNTHEVFVSEDEGEDFDAAKHFDCPEELLDQVHNRPRMARLKTMEVTPASAEANKAAARQYLQLSERIKRKKKLDGLVDTIADKQKLLQKGKRVLQNPSDDPNAKKSYKWLYERKR